jgi:peptide chain release factor 1
MTWVTKLEQVVRRFQDLTDKMSDPTLYERQEELQKLTTERSKLENLVNCYQEYIKTEQDLKNVKDLLINESDPELKEMCHQDLSTLQEKKEQLEKELQILLLPQDPLDDKNVIIEIRAGAGGNEASIFVSDVFRMYQNYLRSQGMRVEVDSISQGDEGIKEIIFSVTGHKVYSRMKYESGVHRVQRVPKTESQGRVHTSTITVAILPEVDDVEFELDMREVRVDVYRSGGSGGQSVNTTDSAVRVTHLPTNTVVAIQDEKSQLKNKEKALKILRGRIFDRLVEEQQKQQADQRKGLIGRGDRSERIRTYNFPQGRLTDHRIGLTVYNLDKIIQGELGDVIDALVAHNQAELLKGQEDNF